MSYLWYVRVGMLAKDGSEHARHAWSHMHKLKVFLSETTMNMFFYH